MWITQSDYVGLATNWISQFSTEHGGFLSPDQLVTITEYITNIKTSITDMLPTLVTNVLSGIISVLGDLPMLLFIFIVIIMSGFYFLTDTKMVFEFLSRNIKSRSFRHKSIQLVDRLSTTLFRVLGGYLLLLIITFTESLIIFWIVGINYSFVLALVTAVLDFMPVLGVSATMVPMMIYFASQGNYTGIVILLIGMAIITVVRRVVEPPILGNAMNMHPLSTLFAMIFGVAVWGAIGFLLGPVVFLIVMEAFKGFSLDKKLRDVLGGILNKFTQ
jgi:sporulation integral membrane protein YtvI